MGDGNIYDKIGGESALVTVVDDFYRRVLADPQLTGFFVGTNMAKLKGRQVAFFAQALGGPELYDGATMRDVHTGRGIAQSDFDKVALHLTESLNEAGVPHDLAGQIMGVIGTLAPDIVSASM